MTTKDISRKLTAIFSADVEGYSRLMGEDEAATVQTLTAYRETMTTLIQQHKGRVVDSPGDNLLAEFSSVVDAVQCAVEVQQILKSKNAELPENRKMKFRIGINLGDVIEEGGRIYGDGVNIASRVEGLADGGGICISGSAYEQIENKLALGYEYLGEHSVKNIAKPIRIYKVPMEPRVSKKKKTRIKGWHWAAVGAFAALIVIVVAATIWNFYLRPTPTPVEVAQKAQPTEVVSKAPQGLPLPDKPSIAVLPLKNISDDPKQEYFADGMTETLITDLSKISGLFVIASNSVFTYKGKSVKIEQIGRELGVRYVLEGSVQRADNQIRINAQLIDTKTGGHIWAERYDDKWENIFALQDKFIHKIVSALAVKLTPSEQVKVGRKDTENIEAYDAFLKGSGHFIRWTSDDLRKAVIYYKKAIELDPNYGRAYAGLGSVYWFAPGGWLDIPWEQGRLLANQYLELAMKNPTSYAYTLSANMNLYLRLYKEAISEAERALVLAPNDPSVHTTMAYVLNWAGRPKEAIEHAEFEMRYDPRHVAFALNRLGLAHFIMGKYEQAASYFERSFKHNPEYHWVLHFLATTYAQLGRNKEAQEILKKYYKESRWMPDLHGLMQHLPFKDPEVAGRYADGLLKAGLRGEPSGYYKMFAENRLSGDEIKKLLFGRKILDEEGFVVYKTNGELMLRGFGPRKTIIYDTGTARVDGDILCHQWEKRLWGLKNCCCIYRNPEGKTEFSNEYIIISYTGITAFSLAD